MARRACEREREREGGLSFIRDGRAERVARRAGFAPSALREYTFMMKNGSLKPMSSTSSSVVHSCSHVQRERGTLIMHQNQPNLGTKIASSVMQMNVYLKPISKLVYSPLMKKSSARIL